MAGRYFHLQSFNLTSRRFFDILFSESEGTQMSKNKNKNTNSTYEVVRKIRGDWGEVNPVTRIIPNKKKNQKIKHKGKEYDYE